MFFQSHIFYVSFRVRDYDQIHLFALVAHLQRRLLVELGQFRPRAGDSDLDSAIVRSDFLSFSGKPMLPLAVRLDHADK